MIGAIRRIKIRRAANLVKRRSVCLPVVKASSLMELLPLQITQQHYPDSPQTTTHIVIADDNYTYSERVYSTDSAPDGIYLCLTHAIAITKRVEAAYKDNTLSIRSSRDANNRRRVAIDDESL